MITISVKTNRSEYALLKTQDKDYAEGVLLLCKMHLGDIYPGAVLTYSEKLRDWDRLEMHPERESIFNQLRVLEFPFPANEMVIEGEYEEEIA